MIKRAFSVIIICLLVVSCGEPKVGSNHYLGKFPGIYTALNRQLMADRRVMNAEIRSVIRNTDTTSTNNHYKALEKIRKREIETMKVRDKYASLERTRRRNASNLATEELNRIKGRKIPFSVEYSDPYLHITDVEIGGADPDSGILKLDVKGVKNRKNHNSPAERSHIIYFVALAPDMQHYLYKGVMEVPFSENYRGNSTGESEIALSGTYPINAEIGLPCSSVDLVAFSGIVFTDEGTFNRLR